MESKVKQTSTKNTNLVLSVDKNGCILNSNEAGNTLLNEWGVDIGGKLPSRIRDLVQNIISQNIPEKMEVKVGNKVYLVVFSPLPEHECVSISGFDISDHQELGEATQQSNERLKALMDHNPSLVFMKDECGRYVYLNSAYEKQFVHSKDWFGKTDFDFWSKESAELFRANDSLVLKSGQTHQFMEDSTDLSGKRYCWLDYKFPFTDSKNKKYVGGIGIDATDRVRAEEALQESEERYKMLFTNMTEGFGFAEVIYNREGKPIDFRYLEINPAFERCLGMNREQLLGKNMREIFHNVSPIAIEKYGEVALSGQPSNFEIFSQVANKYLDIYAFSPEKGKVAIILRDFTSHKQLEEQTRLRAKELETIMEVAPVPILISHDPKGYNITGNRMANEFYGVEVGENISASVPKGGRFFYKGRELRADELPIQQAAKKNMNLRNVELEVLLLSGERRIITVSASPLYDTEDNVRGSVGAFIDITDLKETEDKLKDTLNNLENIVKERTKELEKAYVFLKESERSLAEAQKMAHIGSWEWTSVNNKIRWSDEMYRIFGLKPQEFEITYDLILDFVHPADREYVDNAIKGVLYRKPFDIDFPIIRVDGEERIVHAISEIVFDEKNNLFRVRGTTQDITEHKKVEERINNLANIVESSTEAIITKSFDCIIKSWNKGAEQVYGYSAEEVLEKSMSILEPPALIGETQKLCEVVRQGEKIQQYETLRLRKDGKLINVSFTIFPVYDSQGKITAASIIATDITRRKEAEQKLRESEEKYRNIVETSNEGIYFVNNEAIVTFANKMMETSGYTLHEIIGRPVWNFIPEESLPVAKKEFEKRRKGISGSYELKLKRKDGSYIWTHITAKPFFNKKGKFKGYLAMMTDITQRKEAEETLSNIETARKKEIHHRIKNNLQVISSLLDLQAEQFRNRECIRNSEVLKAFRESQDRVISMALIHEELYKGGEFETLNISSYIEELAESLLQTYSLGNTSISLITDLEKNLFFDMDTAVPLGIIINELVSNSLKHAFSGRDKGEIRIGLHREENEKCQKNVDKSTIFILSVTDNGIGIPEDINIEDIESLGLQLITTLVEQMDGELELKRNNGTEFVIRFSVIGNNDRELLPGQLQLTDD